MPDPMALLKDGVPLSLVVDLYQADGPKAMDIYVAEPADVTWTRELAAEPR
jgi:hypothetical protein